MSAVTGILRTGVQIGLLFGMAMVFFALGDTTDLGTWWHNIPGLFSVGVLIGALAGGILILGCVVWGVVGWAIGGWEYWAIRVDKFLHSELSMNLFYLAIVLLASYILLTRYF